MKSRPTQFEQYTAIRSVALYGLIAFFSGISIFALRPPVPVPADAPSETFSAHRAYKHLKVVAREPHPIGSEAHDRVQAYIYGELERLKLEPQLRKSSFLIQGSSGFVNAANVTNIIARIRGREAGKHILFVGHYDTVPQSAGAADNSSSVAVLLETARALGSSPPPRNDVVFLFTDSEERGLLGAKTFLERNHLAEETGVVINFEARGVGGPAIMFETSVGTGRLIRTYRRAVDHPVAFSVSEDLYSLLPNDTDFSVFEDGGLPGLNFAFIQGPTAYHTAEDDLERLDLRSVQHQGESALGLAQVLGETDLEEGWGAGEAIYFNLLGSFMVIYPSSWAVPSAVLLTLLAATVLILAHRASKWQLGGMLKAIGAFLFSVLIVILGIWALAEIVFEDYNFTLFGDWTSGTVILLAVVLVAAGSTVAFFRHWSGRVGAGNLVAGGLIIWSSALLACAISIPGATYLFSLPLLFQLIAIVAFFELRPAPSRWNSALLGLSAILATLLWAPLLRLVGAALDIEGWLVSGLATSTILFTLLAAQVDYTRPRSRPWILPVGTIGIGMILLLTAHLGSSHSARNPRADSLYYAYDVNSGRAAWVSFQHSADTWTQQFFDESSELGPPLSYLGGPSKVLKANAPAATSDGARVEVMNEEIDGERVAMDLEIQWPFRVHRVLVFLRSEQEIRAFTVGGERFEHIGNVGVGDSAYRMAFSFYAPPEGSMPLVVEATAGSTLEVDVICQRYELPTLESFNYRPRPADLMPGYGWATDSTFIRRLSTLKPGASATIDDDERALKSGMEQAVGG